MAYRTPDEAAAAASAREAARLAEEELRFKKALRIGRRGPFFRAEHWLGARALTRPLLLFMVPLFGLGAGCYAGALVSDALGNVGDFAGALAELMRRTLGGAAGLVCSVWAIKKFAKRRSD